MTGVAAMVQCAARLSTECNLEVIDMARQPEAPPGSCTCELVGDHLFFTLNLDGERVSVGAQTMDQPGPPDTLLRTPDTGQGWELITRFITSLEKYEVRSLVRPILVGDPYYHDPATCWIIA